MVNNISELLLLCSCTMFLRTYLRRQLRQLIRLRVHPAQRLQVLQRGVLGQVLGQVHLLVRAPLRRHHGALHLAHHRVVRRGSAVQVARDLEIIIKFISIAEEGPEFS